MHLLSFEFGALAMATIVWMRSVRGEARAFGFAVASAWFAVSFLGFDGLLVAIAFCLTGYAAALLARWNGRAGAYAIAVLTALFVYLQRYVFLGALLPDTWLARLPAVAGLSFLFFKMVHVAVDYGSGSIRALSLHRYLMYCFNFTAFLMGPIQRFQRFEAQWEGRDEPLDPSVEAHLDAVNRVFLGLVKKYVLASYAARYALMPGAEIGHLPVAGVVAGTYAFYLYLYLDFSGYCDVVIGVGSLMGIRPPENFFLPFFSPNVAQYWLRVHRSLTTWLTDYLFNPIVTGLLRADVFGRRPIVATCFAMMATMCIAGLWHGTTLNFLLFGAVHGIYLVAFRVYEYVMRRRFGRRIFERLRQRRVVRIPAVVLTFLFTGAAYVFFLLEPDQLVVLLTKIMSEVPVS